MGDAALSISIVIPTLNAGRAFGTVLHRIMGQGQAPLEIGGAGTGSTDGTRLRDPERHRSRPFSRGKAAARCSVWPGVHCSERIPVGADAVWGHQVVLSSCTIPSAPEPLIRSQVRAGLRAASWIAVLTGFS